MSLPKMTTLDESRHMMQEGRGRKRNKQQMDMDEFETSGMATSKKKNKHDTADLFASAEEFAHLLEEDTESGQVSLGGTGDFRNKDKAAQKQLKWEADRDRWMTGPKHGHGGQRKKEVNAGGGRKSTDAFAKSKHFKNKGGINFDQKFKAGKSRFRNKKK